MKSYKKGDLIKAVGDGSPEVYGIVIGSVNGGNPFDVFWFKTGQTTSTNSMWFKRA